MPAATSRTALQATVQETGVAVDTDTILTLATTRPHPRHRLNPLGVAHPVITDQSQQPLLLDITEGLQALTIDPCPLPTTMILNL